MAAPLLLPGHGPLSHSARWGLWVVVRFTCIMLCVRGLVELKSGRGFLSLDMRRGVLGAARRGPAGCIVGQTSRFFFGVADWLADKFGEEVAALILETARPPLVFCSTPDCRRGTRLVCAQVRLGAIFPWVVTRGMPLAVRLGCVFPS